MSDNALDKLSKIGYTKRIEDLSVELMTLLVENGNETLALGTMATMIDMMFGGSRKGAIIRIAEMITNMEEREANDSSRES